MTVALDGAMVWWYRTTITDHRRHRARPPPSAIRPVLWHPVCGLQVKQPKMCLSSTGARLYGLRLT